MTNTLSACCKAPVILRGNTTRSWECTKCDKPCDAYTLPNVSYAPPNPPTETVSDYKNKEVSMKDRIVQITTAWAWMGNWEDSGEQTYGLGESGTLYSLNWTYKNDPIHGQVRDKKVWVKVVDNPELTI